MKHFVRSALLAAAAATGVPAFAAHGSSADRTAFVQAGVAEGTQALVAGVTRAWAYERPLGSGTLTGYWEVSFGRWSSESDEGRSTSAWVTQLGVTPVWRWNAAGQDWFVEAGIGANLLLPIYRSRDKRFSTAFNFGDHVAVGRRFAQWQGLEVALRLQHFSNAGIDSPNPGADFLQLRVSRPF